MNSRELIVAEVMSSGKLAGAERIALTLVAEYLNRGIEPRLMTLLSGDTVRKAAPSAVEQVHFGLSGWQSWAKLPVAARHLANWQPTIIHTAGIKAQIVAMLAQRRLPNTFCVNTIHGLTDARSEMTNLIDRKLTRSRQQITAVSKACQAVHSKTIGVTLESIHVIPNGIDFRFFSDTAGVLSARAEAVRAKWNLGDRRVIVVPARIEPIKGQIPFLKLLSETPDVAAVFVGVEGDGGAARKLAESLNLEDRVRFHGFSRDIRIEMLAADVVALPSVSEGFGLALVEAMALGVRAIGSDVGGIPEVLPNTSLTFQLDSATSLQAALEHAESMGRVSVAEREQLEAEYSSTVMVDRYLALYEELMRRF